VKAKRSCDAISHIADKIATKSISYAKARQQAPLCAHCSRRCRKRPERAGNWLDAVLLALLERKRQKSRALGKTAARSEAGIGRKEAIERRGNALPGFPPISPRLISVCSARACASPLLGSGLRLLISESYWSGRRDSNPRPQPWQGCTRYAELRFTLVRRRRPGDRCAHPAAAVSRDDRVTT
jgi:hypothetical protein